MKKKKMNGMNQIKIIMKMITKIKMKKMHRMKVMENKNLKNMKIKIQMKEQMILYLLITRKLNRSKILLKLIHLRMMNKKIQKMKCLSYKNKIILETININNKFIIKATIWENNITLIHKDNFFRLLHNLIR